MRKFYLFLSVGVVLTGCAPEVQVLQKQIKELEATVGKQKQEIGQCQEELDKCNSLADTLFNEKRSTGKDMTQLKAKTRLFIQSEYDSLNRFSKNDELMDYMGGELISRKEKGGNEETVINLDHFPTDSVIYEIKGVFDAATMVVPQLFRKKSDKIVCVWQGPLIEIASAGTVSYEFQAPLNVLKGDFFGFYFPEKVSVPYDTRTGNYSVFDDKVELGEKIPRSFDSKKRNYSIGVVGFLEESGS